MIDINELRRKVNSTDIVDHIDLHANVKPFLSELIDRLEAAEKELVEIRHGAAVANDTIKALRTKIAEMEKQEHINTNELTTFYVWCPSLGITRNDAWEIQHTEAYCAVEDWGEEYSMDNPRSPTGRNIYVEGGDVVEPLTYVLHTALRYCVLPGAKGVELI